MSPVFLLHSYDFSVPTGTSLSCSHTSSLFSPKLLPGITLYEQQSHLGLFKNTSWVFKLPLNNLSPSLTLTSADFDLGPSWRDGRLISLMQ